MIHVLPYQLDISLALPFTLPEDSSNEVEGGSFLGLFALRIASL
jgi:hypothetical protein